MFSSKQINDALSRAIQHIYTNKEMYVINPTTSFTRNRKCTLETIIRFSLTMGGTILPDELKHFFSLNHNDLPTSSAIIQQQKKINTDLYRDIFYFFNEATTGKQTTDGLVLFGADGTDINLPTNKKDKENLIHSIKGRKGYWQMHVNGLFNLQDGRFVDIEIQPRPTCNEVKALCKIVDRYPFPDNSVIVADRGYPAWNLIAHIMEKGLYFLIRTKKPQSRGCILHNLELPASGEYDIDITLGLTRSRKKMYTKHPDKYRIISPARTFDFISPEDYTTVYPLSFRVVSIQLDNGEYEYLLTNLPREMYRMEKLKIYYRMRWGIETGFRHLKYRVSLVNFHSANREKIKQEIYLRLLLYNYVKLVCLWADTMDLLKNKRTYKYQYRVSFSNAVTLVRENIRKRMSDIKLLRLLRQYMIPVKPGRKAPRNVRSQSARSLNYRA